MYNKYTPTVDMPHIKISDFDMYFMFFNDLAWKPHKDVYDLKCRDFNEDERVIFNNFIDMFYSDHTNANKSIRYLIMFSSVMEKFTNHMKVIDRKRKIENLL